MCICVCVRARACRIIGVHCYPLVFVCRYQILFSIAYYYTSSSIRVVEQAVYDSADTTRLQHIVQNRTYLK